MRRLNHWNSLRRILLTRYLLRNGMHDMIAWSSLPTSSSSFKCNMCTFPVCTCTIKSEWHISVLVLFFFTSLNTKDNFFCHKCPCYPSCTTSLSCHYFIELQIYTDSAEAKISGVLDYLGTVIEVISFSLSFFNACFFTLQGCSSIAYEQEKVGLWSYLVLSSWW